jgi:hypothetical protein
MLDFMLENFVTTETMIWVALGFISYAAYRAWFGGHGVVRTYYS